MQVAGAGCPAGRFPYLAGEGEGEEEQRSTQWGRSEVGGGGRVKAEKGARASAARWWTCTYYPRMRPLSESCALFRRR